MILNTSRHAIKKHLVVDMSDFVLVHTYAQMTDLPKNLAVRTAYIHTYSLLKMGIWGPALAPTSPVLHATEYQFSLSILLRYS